MKYVFNWTVGSFFRTLGRIIAYIIIGALVAFAFSYRSKAATLTSYDTYQLYWNGQSGCGSSNKFSYTTYANSDPSGDLWQQGSIGTRVYNKGAEFSFNFQYNLTANKYYDVDINLMSSDLSNALNTTNVYVDSGTSCQDFSGSRVALIGFSLNNSGSNYSSKATIRIMANSATTYWGIRLYKGPTQFIAGPNNFGISSITINEVDPSNTNVIIDNATNNTTNIINNNNENTQQIIDSTRVCSDIDRNSVYQVGYTLDGSGNLVSGNNERGITNYINIQSSELSLLSKTDMIGAYMCFYNVNKSLISCSATRDMSLGLISIPNNSVYMRATIYIPEDKPTFKLCQNGNQATTNAINDVNDTLNDDNVSGATNQASSFFSNFTTNTHGLTSIITAPLAAIQTLTNSTCTPLILPLPYVNRDLTLPCMREIYVSNFGGFMSLYDTITFGIIAYWVLVRIFALVKDFKNPEHDEIEVMDL